MTDARLVKRARGCVLEPRPRSFEQWWAGNCGRLLRGIRRLYSKYVVSMASCKLEQFLYLTLARQIPLDVYVVDVVLHVVRTSYG